MTAPGDDLFDLAGLASLLASGWRKIAACLVGGVLAGGAVHFLIPPRWEGRASVLTSRQEQGMLAGAAGAAAGAGGMAGAATSSLLGGSLATQIETDLALLRSRRLLREVGEQLPLSVRIRTPRAPLASVVRAFTPTGAFRPVTLSATTEGKGRRLRGSGIDLLATPGVPVTLPVGELTLAQDAPEEFTLVLYDLDEGLERTAKRVAVARDGGNVLEVAVRWEDSVTGAQIANGLVGRYLAWRRDADAGDNGVRLRFVRAQTDTVRARLDSALAALRSYQEGTGQLDPEQTGGRLLALSADLNTRLRAVVLEAKALDALFDRIASGTTSVRGLTGFPTFLRSQALNELLAELAKLESERATLLSIRTPEDPSVAGRTEAIRVLESQLEPVARTYAEALAADRARLVQAVDSVADRVAQLPGQGQRYFLLMREVRRLNEQSLALETQLLQLRLATVSEGGTARQVDEAIPTRRPAWPRKLVTFGLGGILGLLVGLALVLFSAPRRRPPMPA